MLFESGKKRANAQALADARHLAVTRDGILDVMDGEALLGTPFPSKRRLFPFSKITDAVVRQTPRGFRVDVAEASVIWLRVFALKEPDNSIANSRPTKNEAMEGRGSVAAILEQNDLLRQQVEELKRRNEILTQQK